MNRNPLGIHTECGPLNAAGQPLHLHIWPMNADHTRRWKPVEYVGKHRGPSDSAPNEPLQDVLSDQSRHSRQLRDEA